MSNKAALETVLTFLVNHTSGPKLAEFARRAHLLEINQCAIDMANQAHQLMGDHPIQEEPNFRDRLILALHQKYSHLISEDYRHAGIEMAHYDLKKPLFHDPKTGGIYTLS
ncbi:hypothetical protein HYW20_05700 [Candidatus Woesearchaeota archaeon]|nr:hypothetical protein [Candidatus Woesearchaeota archaeon]